MNSLKSTESQIANLRSHSLRLHSLRSHSLRSHSLRPHSLRSHSLRSHSLNRDPDKSDGTSLLLNLKFAIWDPLWLIDIRQKERQQTYVYVCCPFFSRAETSLVGSPSNCSQSIHRIELIGAAGLVVETSLHLPISQVEPALCATVQTNSIRMTLVRKWSAQFHMPATKDPRHPISNSLGHGRRTHLTDSWCRDC